MAVWNNPQTRHINKDLQQVQPVSSLNNKCYSQHYYSCPPLPNTHIIIRRSTNTLLGQAAAEKILPLDILSFWHNIDFRREAAGGSLVTFHITLEICAELSAQTAVEQGGGGQVERGRDDGRGKEPRNASPSSKVLGAFTVICCLFTQH